MDCKKALELITPFVNGKLNTNDTEEFLKHIDECDTCREELEVSYSLMTAMRQLDAGEELSDNYVEELDQKIEDCYMAGLRVKKERSRRRVLLGIFVFLFLLMTGSIVSENRGNTADHLSSLFMSEEEEEKQRAKQESLEETLDRIRLEVFRRDSEQSEEEKIGGDPDGKADGN